MYKVFFNDSTIEIGSGDKKSFKNNIKSIDEYFGLILKINLLRFPRLEVL